MFFTDTIPKYVWNSKMFAFSIYNPDTKQVASSQFLYAESGNEVLGRTLCGLYKYWENNDKLITYYLFHYFFAVAVDCRSTCKELWDSTPKYFSEVNHVLQRELFNDYSDEKWRYFEKVSFVHKLSYKHIDKEKINKRTTFYNKIIGNLYYE